MRTHIKAAILRTLCVSIIVLSMLGCTDADVSGFQAYGQKHHIKQYSGGQLVGEWTSTGKVSNEGNSDGYYFEDDTTHKIVELTGTIQVTIQ
jgi:hypothetical protein